MNLLFVEMRRALHRRLVRWMLVLAAALCALAGVLAFVNSGDYDARPTAAPAFVEAERDAHIARLADLWRPESPESSILVVLLLFLAVGAFVCGASVVGAEWKAGTVATALTWEPRRVRLLGARFLTCLVLAFLLTVALIGVFILAILPNAVVNGDTSGLDADWWRAFAGAVLRIGIVGGLAATLGAAIASLGRNSTAAIVAMFAWFMVVENMVRGLWPRWQNFLIGESVPRFVTATPLDGVERYTRSTAGAAVLIAAYAVGAAVLATTVFARRDVA